MPISDALFMSADKVSSNCSVGVFASEITSRSATKHSNERILFLIFIILNLILIINGKMGFIIIKVTIW